MVAEHFKENNRKSDQMKCYETCIDAVTEEICQFIKNVCNAI